MASIQSLGVGSGLLTSKLVDDIIAAEREATDLRIDTRKTELEAKISAFGSVRSTIEKLRSAASALSRTGTLLTNVATSSQPTSVSATATTRAEAGVHTVEIQRLARSHTLASVRYDDIADTLGTGTLTFRFGTTTFDEEAAYAGFVVNPDRSGASLTINSSNNSLTGVRDAINAANIGVSAGIVNDGQGFRLVLSSRDTGAANSMEIVVAEGDTAGLSALAFNQAANDAETNLTQSVAAQDAAAVIDGIAITRASNTVGEVISGVTFQLLAVNDETPANVSIGQDTKNIVDRMQGFVDAFNEMRDLTDELTAFDAEKEQGALLMGDATVRNVRAQLRRLMGASFPGLGTGELKSLVDLGVTTDQNTNFRLKLDTAKLTAALLKDPDAIEGLLATRGSASDSRVEFIGFQAPTESGEYTLNVTRLATHGLLSGASTPSLAGATVIDADNDDFIVRIDGISSATLHLTHGSYTNGAALATELAARINADANLDAAGVAATVEFDTVENRFVISAASWGSRSSVAIDSVDTNSALQLGLAVGAGGSGVDVAGRINGIEATGSGQFLTTPSGPQPARSGFYEGTAAAAFPLILAANSSLALNIDETVSGTVTLDEGTYTTGADLAAEIAAKVNNDTALTGAGVAVSVEYDLARGLFTITSNSKGSASTIALTDVAPDIGVALGLAAGAGTPGRNATTINDRASGLQVRVAGGETGERGTVSFTRGTMNQIDRFLSAALSFQGSFGTKLDSLEEQVTKLDEEKATFDKRMSALEIRLRTQFAAADALVSKLNSTASFLDQQLKNLPVFQENK